MGKYPANGKEIRAAARANISVNQRLIHVSQRFSELFTRQVFYLQNALRIALHILQGRSARPMGHHIGIGVEGHQGQQHPEQRILLR